MAKIFAVNRGQYSDYSVVALFSTEEKAKEFMKTFNGDDEYYQYNNIEEYELDSEAPRLVKDGYFVWSIMMDRDGNVTRINKKDPPDAYDFGELNKGNVWKNGITGLSLFHNYVLAKDKKHAIKITNEKRAQLIAMGKWSGDE
jgi:hypothetical protein